MFIIDRTSLILEIFAQRAYSKEAILQVEIARENYRINHLVGTYQDNYGQQGGSGFRGAGETKLELDRRRLKNHIRSLIRELKLVVKQRQVQRKRRKHNNVKQVALVGYTNSGKSTLLNLLVGKNPKKVLAEDRLFATLQTSSRLVGDFPFSYIVTDTVGFISKLPTYLINAFNSTLEEIKEADLLLLVADLSDKHCKKQIEKTLSVLKELGCENLPLIIAYNKADLVDEKYLPVDDYENIIISCTKEYHIKELRALIKEKLFSLHRVKLFLSWDKYHLLTKIKREEEIFSVFENAEGIEIIGAIQDSSMDFYREFLI